MSESSATPVPPASPAKPEITYEDFSKLDLRVATVLEAAAHPNADKLIVLKADLGGGVQRQIIAGIRPWYEPASLVGKSIVMVANLAPRKMRFGVSQGMILCASGVDDGSGLFLLDSDDGAMPGMRVS